MIQPKNKTEDILLSITQTVKHLLNKPIKKQKRHWNLKLSNQEKHSISVHNIQLKDAGWLFW